MIQTIETKSQAIKRIREDVFVLIMDRLNQEEGLTASEVMVVTAGMTASLDKSLRLVLPNGRPSGSPR